MKIDGKITYKICIGIRCNIISIPRGYNTSVRANIFFNRKFKEKVLFSVPNQK